MIYGRWVAFRESPGFVQILAVGFKGQLYRDFERKTKVIAPEFGVTHWADAVKRWPEEMNQWQ